MRFLLPVIAGSLTMAACHDASEVFTPAALPAAAAPLHSAAAGRRVEGAYIVVVKEGTDPRSVAAIAGVKPKFVYSAAVNGFAGPLTDGQLNALRRNPGVDYVEEDQVVEGATTQTNPKWNLDRIDQDYYLNAEYNYTATASGVYAYVIDTGIYISHPEFGGRASIVYDVVGTAYTQGDCHGHGTHVAGIIGSATYGVAKQVQLRGLRVLDCNNQGTTSGVIAAVDWLRYNRSDPAVANLSTGGAYSSTLNSAVNNLAYSGVFVAVAAGNGNQDACNTSPASASAATTVAASEIGDYRASFSNYGSCVDLYAPGVAIWSTWLYNNTNLLDGTSMAAPHVAGVAALYKATYGNAASSTIDLWLKNNATPHVNLVGNPSGTTNRMLHKRAL